MSQTNWDRFRVETISPATFAKRALIHADLVRSTLARAGRAGVLEVGIGSGAQSALLSRFAPTVSVDNDLRILRAALPNVRRFGRGLRVLAGDGFRLPFPDETFGVALSQGLMEHFSDDRIAELVREQLRVCRSVVFSVPSDNYPRQDVGDERLMPPSRWREIVLAALPAGAYAVQARYARFDVEALKYSALARRWLGGFGVVVTVDRA